MRKLIIFIVILMIEGCHVAYAQMDQITYSRWVDTVCRRYIDAYYDSKKGNITTEVETKAQELRDCIENKKNIFNKAWTKEEIIKHLISLPTDRPTSGGKNSYAGYLKTETKTLKAFLEAQIEDKSANAGLLATVSREPDRDEKDSSWAKWVTWIIVIALFVGVGYRYRRHIERFFKTNGHNSRSKIYGDGYYINPSAEDITFKTLENRVRKLEQRIGELEKQPIRIHPSLIADELMKNESFRRVILADLKQISTKIDNPRSLANDNDLPAQRSQNHQSFYADTINDGEFHRVCDVPTNETVYELRKLSDKTAIFRVYPEAYARVLRRPNFLEGCDVQKVGGDGVDTIELGEAIYDQGVWRIRKRAKVKFV